jgi:hypothetical protein
MADEEACVHLLRAHIELATRCHGEVVEPHAWANRDPAEVLAQEKRDLLVRSE